MDTTTSIPGRVPAPSSRLRELAEDERLSEAARGELLAIAAEVEGVGAVTREFVARGGMGEVFRVEDPRLGRTVILKTLPPRPASREPSVRARFVTEARVTALLDHPGVVPVHDLGVGSDGLPYFTMREVRGVTMSALIDEVHAAVHDGHWGATPSGWTFARLVQVFERVCETVAYAHTRGVVHRDLKPDNVMIGAFGEVLVLDWGVAAPAAHGPRGAWTIEPARIAGTPAYMAPEQAWGEAGAVDPRADVYSLGAILYELLCGRRPFEGSAQAILAAVRQGPPPPPWRSDVVLNEAMSETFSAETLSLTSAANQLIPEALREICLRAMERDPRARYPDAAALALEVREWLDGRERRELADAMTQRAAALGAQSERMSAEADAARARATELLAGLPPWADVEERRAGWALEARADELGRRVAELELESTELLHAALIQSPGLVAARDVLADMYRRQHAHAEARRDRAEALRLELLLRAYDTGRHSAYLAGAGAISLVTDPPGARVRYARFELQERRLVAVQVGDLGETPLRARALPMGSWLLELSAPGRAPVRYPVHIARGQHWDGLAPGRSAPTPVVFPRTWEMSEDERYVPAGWFLAGDGPDSPGAGPPTRLWVDAFVARTFPVTNQDYLEFLNDLAAGGDIETALRHAPRERGSSPGELGALIYGFADARFSLQPDADGDVWLPDWPVTMIDWFGAAAYAAWFARRTGQPWRLLAEAEWEKAARGVDGRIFPWGDHFEATWARVRESRPGRALPGSVFGEPTDVSPYGVRGMAGGARTWCSDVWNPAGLAQGGPRGGPDDPRVIRGGAWSSGPRVSRGAARDGDAPTSRKPHIGVRLGRSLG